jgi:hypothetical protein
MASRCRPRCIFRLKASSSNSGFPAAHGRRLPASLINDDELMAHAVPNAQGNDKIGDDFVPAVERYKLYPVAQIGVSYRFQAPCRTHR